MPVILGAYGATGAAGWTVITPSDGTQASGLTSNVIYVSDSTGNDTTGDGTLANPVKTIKQAWHGTGPGKQWPDTTGTGLGTQGAGNGFAFCTRKVLGSTQQVNVDSAGCPHAPDWILLKKGDTFTDQQIGWDTGGITGAFPFNGFSADEPMVISSYSTTGVTSNNPRGTGTGARPVMKITPVPGYAFSFGSNGGWNSLDYFAIIGLNWYQYKCDPGSNLITPGVNASYLNTQANETAISINVATNWWLLEDNIFAFFNVGASCAGQLTASITGFIDNGAGAGTPSGVAGTVLTVTAVPTGFTGLIPTNGGLCAASGQGVIVTGTGVSSSNQSYPLISSQITGTPGGVGRYNVTGASQLVGSESLTVTDNFGYHSIAHQSVNIRRNVFAYQYNTAAGDNFACGMVIDNAKDMLIEENVLYNNGWYDGTTGNIRSIYNHGVYMQCNDASFNYSPAIAPNPIVRGNIVAKSSGHGLHLRAGGQGSDNLFYQNGIALNFGYAAAVPVSLTNKVDNNVVFNSQGDSSGGTDPWGVHITGVSTQQNQINVTNNIVAHKEGVSGYLGISIGTSNEAGNNPAAHNAVLTGNVVVDWPDNSGGTVAGSLGNVSGCNIVDFSTGQVNVPTWSGNTFVLGTDLTGHGWTDPTRTILTYDTSIGGAGTANAFFTSALGQSADNWSTNLTANTVNNYIRTGFNIPLVFLAVHRGGNHLGKF